VTKRAAWLAWVLLAPLSCAPAYAPGYQEAFDAALRAQNAGRWEEAATLFDKAAGLGDRYKDRDEARLMAAEALERLERWGEAEDLYRKIDRESEGRYQGVRAAYALGRLVWQQRGFEEGAKETLRAIRSYPDSGLVRHAVKRLLAHVEETYGPDAALAWLTPLYEELKTSDAEEAVGYEHATLLARCGKKEASIAALLALAASHPYPHGSLTDDAYYVASLYLADLDRVPQAINALEKMLSVQEEAHLGHSYRRPRFPQGAYRIGVLYRDRVKDRERAKAAFWRVYKDYFDSRQTDDALWALAKMERDDGRPEEACRVLEVLRKEKPDSRYLSCLHHLCDAQAKGSRPCSLRVLEGIGVDADAVWEGVPAPAP
jgi:tetratricopeptide (TPR) repeat protein